MCWLQLVRRKLHTVQRMIEHVAVQASAVQQDRLACRLISGAEPKDSMYAVGRVNLLVEALVVRRICWTLHRPAAEERENIEVMG